MESTRLRSPNYPSYSLQAAIELAHKLWEANKRAPVAPIVIGQALSGNESAAGLSGPQRTKIAALRQFGLLEETGSGKMRVSDRALAILQKPTPATYASAIREAALAPPLFADLHAQYAEASDGAVKYYLMTEKSFTEDGAVRAIKSYRDTMAFASLSEPSYNDEANPTDEMQPNAEKPINKGPSAHQALIAGRSREDNLSDKVLTMAYTWPLPDGVDAQVTLFGARPTSRSIDRLITYLQFMRDDLAAAPPPMDPTDGPTADPSAGD